MSSVVGIDIGNKNCVLGVPSTHGVDVVSNQSSNRLTPTMVTYSNERRYAGELSFQHQSEFYKSTITNLKHLIGLKYDSEDREKLEKLITFKLVKLDDGFTGISVEYKDTEIILKPEQCIAYLLKDLIQIAKTANSNVSKAVVSVSPWWTDYHRRTLLNAVKIGKIDCLSLVNSTTAAAVTYVKTHPERLPAKDADPVPLLLIDMGDYSMNVAIALIKKDYVKIVSSASDQHLGGQIFTAAFLPYLLEKTQEKYKINPRDNPRSWLRFQAAAEKVKKTLSVNPAVQFDVPSLMNDIDVTFVIKREDFNARITELVDRIPDTINKALEQANIKKEDLNVIEALGGGARVAAVKDKIVETLGKEFTQTLNLDECFAIGSGYIAQKLTGEYKDLEVYDVTPFEVKSEYTVNGETKTEQLFPQFSQIPSTKTFKISVEDKSSIKVFTECCQIGTIDVNLDGKKADVDITVALNESSMLEFKEAKISGDNSENVVPSVTFTINGDISSENLDLYSKLEEEMTEKDNKEKQIDNARNDLESMIFEAENGINRDFPNSFEPSELTKFKKDVQDIHDWFTENEFDRLPIEEYNTRLDTIKKTLEPVKERANKYKKLFEDMVPLKDRANTCLDLVKTDADRVDHGEKEKLQKDLQDYLEELDKAMNSPLYVDPTFSSKDFIDKMEGLEKRKDTLERLPLKPRPQPQAVPTKIEQPESESSGSNEENNDEEEEEEEEQNQQPTIIGRDFWGRPIYGTVPRQQPKKQIKKQKPKQQKQTSDYVDNPEDYYYDRFGNIVGRRAPQQKSQPQQQQQRRRQQSPLQQQFYDDEDNDDNYGYNDYGMDPLAALFGAPQRKRQQQQRMQPQQQRYYPQQSRRNDLRRQNYYDDDDGYGNDYQDDDDYDSYQMPQSARRRQQQAQDPYELYRQQQLARQQEFERRRQQQEAEERALAEKRRRLQKEERRYREQQRQEAERLGEMQERQRRAQLNRRRAGPGFDFWQPQNQSNDPFWGGGSPFFF